MTRQFAIDRLARSVCADRTTFDERDAQSAAQWVENAQLDKLGEALARVRTNYPASGSSIVVAGSGEFLARRLVESLSGVGQVVSLGKRLGAEGSQAATALAVATLAKERR
jgi:uncharacterized hydantoinase/oxoprolinase family protein